MATIIKNVNVFDGTEFIGVQDVIIDGKYIVDTAPEDAEVIDGTGKTLLPGLWDAHGHLYDRPDFLEKCLQYGTTTICDMGCRERETVDKMKAAHIVNSLTPYLFVCAPTSAAPENMHYTDMTRVTTPEEGRQFVDTMVEWGADYIKMILEEQNGAGRTPGAPFPVEIGKAIMDQAHQHGKKVIAHATDIPSLTKAVEIGVDVITHMPMAGEVPDALVQKVVEQGQVLTPTITMMEGIATSIKKMNPNAPVSKEIAEHNLKKFIAAGVPVLVSTDANEDDPCPPASVEYGKGTLDEMMNMQECGLEPQEILACATGKTATYFGQTERGFIAPGKIADLLLVDGIPEEDLTAIYKTHAVWFEGVKKVG